MAVPTGAVPVKLPTDLVTTVIAFVGAIGAPAVAAALAIGFRTSFIDIDRSSTKVSAVKGRDGSFGFFGVRHFNKAKASRAARIPIGDNTDPFHGSVIFKQGAKRFFRRPKTEVSYKYIFHVFTLRFERGRIGQTGTMLEWRLRLLALT